MRYIIERDLDILDITDFIKGIVLATSDFRTYYIVSLGIHKEYIQYNLIGQTLEIYDGDLLKAACEITYSVNIYYI